jgi:hypothetical protein
VARAVKSQETGRPEFLKIEEVGVLPPVESGDLLTLEIVGAG